MCTGVCTTLDGPGQCSQCSQLTQYGHHHIVPKDLDGATGDEVEGGEHVPTMHQGVTGWGVGGLEAHGQRPQAALVGPAERLAVLQQCAVQVQTDVRLQALWKPLQNLHKRTAKSI